MAPGEPSPQIPRNGRPGTFAWLAESLRYPFPGLAERLRDGLAGLPEGAVRRAAQAFLAGVEPLSPGEWEELYTRTLDLGPLAAPYVGFQLWGEGYARGNFMAELNGALRAAGVETDGELPDHLVPVLRCLDQAPQPLAGLVENLQAAVKKMGAALQQAEPGNPYLHLFSAVLLALQPERA